MLAARDRAKAGEECPAGRWRFEMIAGTMVFEDQSLHWQLLDGDVVRYTITEGFEGNTEMVECSWAAFGAAMALAIGSDEMPGAEALYLLAEPAMPKAGILRWIP